MKKLRNTVVAALLLLSLSSCADDNMTFTGTVTSLPEGCRYVLTNWDKDQSTTPFPSFAIEKYTLSTWDDGLYGDTLTVYANIEATENFTITAKLDGPTLLRFDIMKYIDRLEKYVPVASVTFFADNEKVKMNPVSFDDFVEYTNQEVTEENIVISGGRVQKQYKEYIDSLRPIKEAINNLWEDNEEMLNRVAQTGIQDEETEAMVRRYYLGRAWLFDDIDLKTHKFAALRPDYAISALIASRELNTYFRYTKAEIDSIFALIEHNPDKHRVEIARKNAATATQYALKEEIGSEEVTMADGTKRNLRSLLADSGYTLIDCWASWCGPCRISVPRLKKLYTRFYDKLKIVSISCDRQEADWRKALDEENMPWEQAILDADQAEPFMKAYEIRTIPRFILVENGRIYYSGNDLEWIESLFAPEEYEE